MAVDDLTAPLKARRWRPGHWLQSLPDWQHVKSVWLRPTPVVAVLLLLVVASGGLYVLLRGEPTGGEPVAVVALDKIGPEPIADMRGAQPTEGAVEVAQPDKDKTRLDDGAVETVDTGDGGAKIIIIRPEEGIREPPLSPVPDSRLVERTDQGILPKRAEDGTAPMTVYARPHEFTESGGAASDRPRVAILVNGMGLNGQQSSEAIRVLPADVTFAFAPYADGLQKWAAAARQDGHEVMLQVPLEPFDFPDNDPGPHTLLSSLTPAENLERLHWVMTRMVGYAGVTNYMGARFTASREVLRPMLLELKKRGILYIDDGTSPRSLAESIADEINLPARRSDVVLDAVPAPDAITAALERLEVEAFQNGVAVGVISALPVSIRTVSEWLETLPSRGIEIIPVSATTKAVAEG